LIPLRQVRKAFCKTQSGWKCRCCSSTSCTSAAPQGSSGPAVVVVYGVVQQHWVWMFCLCCSCR
jgi:hypothetical protein